MIKLVPWRSLRWWLLCPVIFLGGCGSFNFKPQDYCPTLGNITLEMLARSDIFMGLDPDNLGSWQSWEDMAIAFGEQVELIQTLAPEQFPLIEYQNQLGQIYQDYRDGTRMMVEARQNHDRDLALKAQDLVTQAGAREQALIPELNQYCQTPFSDRLN